MALKKQAVAYFRTSSAANIGPDKDSERRQREAVTSYANSQRISLVAEYYDAAVSGTDPIDQRKGFVALLEKCQAKGISTVLVENASRFARDLGVQLAGHALLRRLGIELVPVDAPTYFTDPTPTAEMVRQILGAVSQFEKSSLVHKLRGARERIRQEKGRCEGRKPVPDKTVALAKRLARVSPKTHQRRSLRSISAELAAQGHTVLKRTEEGWKPSDRPYGAYSIQLMLSPKNRKTPKANA